MSLTDVNLPQLAQEDTFTLKNPVSAKEIVFAVKNLPTKKTSDPSGFIGEVFQTFKKKANCNSSQTFPKNRRGELSSAQLRGTQHYPNTKPDKNRQKETVD